MGNSEGHARAHNLKDFQMQKYLNQGLNQNQILQVKQAFDSYQPENGQIDLGKLRQASEQSQSKDKINKLLGSKDTMNFDQFFAMSRELLSDEIKKNPTMILDSSEVEATCLFCPYAVDKKH